MHKVFISFHSEDEYYKLQLQRMNASYGIFLDYSVDTGDIPDTLPDQRIREIIRDSYLRESAVTILLVGQNTWRRKHVDWELYSSMYNGSVNKQSGILIIMLPETNCGTVYCAHGEQACYEDITNWHSVEKRSSFENDYPYLPARIIDNMINPEAKISITNWNRIINNSLLSHLIEVTYRDRQSCNYDLSREMRRNNS